jgi:hypothetical protein
LTDRPNLLICGWRGGSREATRGQLVHWRMRRKPLLIACWLVDFTHLRASGSIFCPNRTILGKNTHIHIYRAHYH